MSEEIKICPHDIVERETADFDGACSICFLETIASQKEAIRELVEALGKQLSKNGHVDSWGQEANRQAIQLISKYKHTPPVTG